MGIFKIKNPRFSDCKTVLSHFLKYNGAATFISKFKPIAKKKEKLYQNLTAR